MRFCSTLLFTVLLSFSAFAERPCANIQCGEAARFSLSEKGIEKIMSLGLNAMTQQNDLKDEANQYLKDAKFPYKFDLGNTRVGQMSASVDNVKFNKLKFGKSKVDVNERKMNVCIPVDEMDLSVDASLDIMGSQLNQKGARAYVNESSPDKPKVCFKAEVDESGQVGPLVQVKNEVPTDVAKETKMAMLDIDLNQANEDEILFTYMTLYMMEENMALPTKVDMKSIYHAIRDPNPETLKKLVDIDAMRESLKNIKKELPPQTKKDKEGIVDYVGNLKIDLNLEQNQNSLKSDNKIWDDAYNILNEKDESNAEGGFFSSITNLGKKLVKAGKRVADGAIQNLKVGAEDVVRKRFLPYLQESFNKNVTGSSPIMTAVAKTAEKNLVALAKEKANMAIAEFQKAQGVQNGNFSTKIKEPLWNIQDITDFDTLRKNEEAIRNGNLKKLFSDSFYLNKLPNKKLFNSALENELSKIENYLNAINPKSSDQDAADFLYAELKPLIKNINQNLLNSNVKDYPLDLRDKVMSIYQKIQMKESLLNQKISERNSEKDVRVSIDFFNKVSRGPQVSLSLPELCQQGVGSLPNSSKLKSEEIRAHDVSGEVSVPAMNAYAKQRALKGDFDFCMLDNEMKSCSNGNNYNNRCRLLEPPQLKWNEKKQKHEIELKNIQCESRVVNADPKCNMGTKSKIPVLGFIFNGISSGVGSLCKLASDQADNLITSSQGQNLISVKVEVDPQVCGNALCLNTKLADSKVTADLERLNPNLASIVGKISSLVLSPFTEYVKKEIVDKDIMNFMSKKISKPLEAPSQIQLKRITSERGKFVVLADIDDSEKTEKWINNCVNYPTNCDLPYSNSRP